MKYTVLEIFEEDYGCEGVPENEEPMCSVLVRNENGIEKWLKISDNYLTQHNIRKGEAIEWNE
ncbi:MAG: hypothetical protein K6G33_05100 [Ruminococcus sp.]|uniref:hypothetical protein n=1 Tax=Ruminococcus sp. TaxID=41978 RepID=UPI0025E70650|nr:hypothetical protein [Ruminococcus sp.]MCR5600100.1 hypothetical protein [Ruminococcus sp.]